MNSTGTIILAISLVIIMIGMGLSLTIADFRRIIIYPKAVFAGIVNQIVLLPIVGWLIVVTLGLSYEIAVGMMILAACPGGPTSNLVTHLAKGDTALSVTLTAINSILTIFTIPFIIQFALVYFMNDNSSVTLNIPQIIGQLLAITFVPIIIGMTIKAKASAFAEKMSKPVKIVSALVLLLVIIGLIVTERENVVSYFLQAGLPALFLNLITMTLGYFSSKILSLDQRQSISISIESGIQNGTLAIAIATITLGNTAFAIPGAIYSLIMYMTAGTLIWIGAKGRYLVKDQLIQEK